jgi:hypothetical protein
MAALNGYVRVYRKLTENPIWIQLAPPVLKVAIYFLLQANYKPSQWYDGKDNNDVPAGSFITSYASTAEACNLSVKQVRGAFSHLSRAQFAAYTRADRWTLVTVLNWASYQPSSDDQGTDQGTDEGFRRAGRGQQLKNIRSKEYTPEREEFDLDGIPFDTLDQLSEEKTPDASSPGRNGSAHHTVLSTVASAIHARHPNAHSRRDCGAAAVEKQLEAILKHKRIPPDEREDYLRRVDANHASMCASDQWTKNGGEFAKSLSNWLAPTKERYDVEASLDSTSESRPRYVL